MFTQKRVIAWAASSAFEDDSSVLVQNLRLSGNVSGREYSSLARHVSYANTTQGYGSDTLSSGSGLEPSRVSTLDLANTTTRLPIARLLLQVF
jgi:hypothetical protein